MSLKNQFLEYRSRVANANEYPFAPQWVKDKLLERLDVLLALQNPQEFEVSARSFPQGAARTITDQCGSECDDILEDIPDG
jgi:hypothetical protein